MAMANSSKPDKSPLQSISPIQPAHGTPHPKHGLTSSPMAISKTSCHHGRTPSRPQERWDVAQYLYTLAYSPEQIEQGQALWETHCVNCDANPLADDLSLSDSEALSQLAAIDRYI